MFLSNWRINARLTPGASMLSTALTMIAAILTTVAVTVALDATQTPERMGVRVMLRGEIDHEKLKKGSNAYVEYKSRGVEGVMWGLIVQINPDGIVIESETAPSETRKIGFGDVDLLAVADDRQTLGRWQAARKAAANVTVKSRGELDLSELETGSYAYVVYTWRGLRKRTSGKIAAIDPSGLRSRWRLRNQRPGQLRLPKSTRSLSPTPHRPLIDGGGGRRPASSECRAGT